MNSRRNFLKKCGFAAGALTATGFAAPLVYSKESPLHEDDMFDGADKLFPNLRQGGVVPSTVVKDAILSTEIVEPDCNVPTLKEGGEFPVQAWADEAVRLLQDSMSIGSLIHRNFTPEPAQHGDIVCVPRPRGWSLGRSELNRPHRGRVPLSNHVFCKFILHDGDYQRPWKDLVNLFLVPSVVAMGLQIDMHIYETIAASSFASVSNRDTRELVLDARQHLNETKTWTYGRHMLVSPTLDADIMRDSLLTTKGHLIGFDTGLDTTLPAQTGFAFHRDALTLACRPYPFPMGFFGVDSARGMLNDLCVLVTTQYDISKQGTIVTLTCLTGVDVSAGEMCVNIKKDPPRGASTFRKGKFDVNVNVKPGHDPREIASAVRRELRRPQLTNEQITAHLDSCFQPKDS